MSQSIVRGATVFFTVAFQDKYGNPTTPSGATLRLAYGMAGARQTAEIAMSSDGSGNWAASWDTSPADAGWLYWWAHSAGSPAAACQGRIEVQANPANPQASS